MELIVVILYCFVTGLVLIWCSLQGPKKGLNYVVISALLLADWRRQRANLIVIELEPRNLARSTASDVLLVPVRDLRRLLRWIPPETTLVLCGRREAELCRAQIEHTLLGAGIDVVYILNEETGPQSASATPCPEKQGALHLGR